MEGPHRKAGLGAWAAEGPPALTSGGNARLSQCPETTVSSVSCHPTTLFPQPQVHTHGPTWPPMAVGIPISAWRTHRHLLGKSQAHAPSSLSQLAAHTSSHM